MEKYVIKMCSNCQSYVNHIDSKLETAIILGMPESNITFITKGRANK